MLRGDIKARYEAYHFAINDGWMNGNEARKKENMESKDELEDHYMNGNMQRIKDVGKDKG